MAKLVFPAIGVCSREEPVRASDDSGVACNQHVLLKYPGDISGVTQLGGAPYMLGSSNPPCVCRLHVSTMTFNTFRINISGVSPRTDGNLSCTEGNV